MNLRQGLFTFQNNKSLVFSDLMNYVCDDSRRVDGLISI